MKRTWILLTLTLLLCGCGREAPGALPEPLITEQTLPQEMAALRAVPMDSARCLELHPMGEDLLLLTAGTESVTVSRLSHETLATTASAEVALSFSGLQVWGDRLCYYDSQARQTVALDGQLQEVFRIDAPEGLSGVPLLSENCQILYYCTQDAVRSLEISTGTSRVLKEDHSPHKTLKGLLLGDTVLHCGYADPILGDRSLFLSANTGRTLLERSGDIQISSRGSRYYASIPEALVFGSPDQRSRVLLPQDPLAQGTLIPESGGAVTAGHTGDGTTVLSYYDLEAGKRTGELILSTDLFPRSFCSTEAGIVYFLLYDDGLRSDILCRWDVSAAPVNDDTPRTALYYTAGNPDLEGLERCREEAQRISRRFGVQVLIWTDANQTEPWDYSLEPEHRVEVLRRELQLLEERLARYPEGFLKALDESVGGLRVCLVRSISPTPDNPGAPAAEGIQFWAENRCYIALAMGEGCERSLYHELCHLIDTRVLTLSHAYDDWDSLNPGDFQYDYDYIRNRSRDGQLYLRETSRSFIDTYSMSFPREDRARIMEYAMTAGNAALFNAPILQQKLTKLCTGIREAFGLIDYPPLPWEQYLLKPLAPASQE